MFEKMTELGPSILTQTAMIVNWLILAVIIFCAIYFVGRDARKRGYSRAQAIFWVLLSIFTFPIGFGLYFLLRKLESNRKYIAEEKRQ